jgi:hypothetical protein
LKISHKLLINIMWINWFQEIMLNLFLFERFSLQKQNFIFEWIQVLENFMTYFIFRQKIILLFAWKRKFLLILALMWKLFIYFLKLVNFKLDFTIRRYYLLLSGLKILLTIYNYKEYSLYGGSLYVCSLYRGTTV